MAVHNAALGQGLPDGDGVHIVQIVLFNLGVETVLLDELSKSGAAPWAQGSSVPSGLPGRTTNGALPSPPSNSRASHAAVSFSPCMVLHVADNGVFTLDLAVPLLDSPVNVIVRKRAQQLMELGIGLVDYLPVQALPELRGVRIEAKQPHITGPQDSTANSGVASITGVLVVTVTAGVPVSGVLGNSLQHDGLVLLMQLPEGGGLDGFFIPERPESICAVLRFVVVDVLFGLMVNGEYGILPRWVLPFRVAETVTSCFVRSCSRYCSS